MKIRSGFVSNSSSSSFIILGKNIDIRDISFSKIKENEIYVFGVYLNEGQDVFKVDSDEMLAFFKAYDKLDLDYARGFKFIETYTFIDSESTDEIDLSILPKEGKANIISGDKDYNSSYSLEDLKCRYDLDGQVSSELEKILRNKKLEKLTNI